MSKNTFNSSFARYVGENTEFGLRKDQIYAVACTYGTNVTLQVTSYKRTSVHPHKVIPLGVGSLSLEAIFKESRPIIEVHSLLMYNNQVAGVRFKSDYIKLFDIELECLGDIDLTSRGYAVEELKPYGSVLMTETEFNKKATTVDLSLNKGVCTYILDNVLRLKLT